MIYGFIGVGNMGGALARALAVSGSGIYLADKNSAKAEALALELGAKRKDNLVVAEQCHTIFLGVKPQMMGEVLAEIAPALQKRDQVLLVSMAAGLTMEDIRRMAGGEYPIIRIMPNMPAAVGEGMILYDCTDNVEEETLCDFLRDMKGAGRFDRLEERLIDGGSAVSGCGPAYAFLFMEALADGGVLCGLPRDKAMTYAAQMLLGSARMVLETGEHPGALKDKVCSPGGTTIAGVKALEEGGFRAAAIRAVADAYLRTLELGK